MYNTDEHAHEYARLYSTIILLNRLRAGWQALSASKLDKCLRATCQLDLFTALSA